MNPQKLLITLSALGVFAGGVFALIAWSNTLPEGPVPIAWDAEACAECRMHVGEPAFAVQLQTEDGEVLNFDDPGCALRFLTHDTRPLHALYFHSSLEDTWLTRSQIAFVPTSRSPMGYGLSVVPKETQGALTFAQATARALSSPELLSGVPDRLRGHSSPTHAQP